MIAHVRLSWLTPEQGGRRSPIVAGQGRYVPTARFAGDEGQFSVVMEFEPTAGDNPEQAVVRLLNPQLADVRRRLIANAHFEVMEGARKVADGWVVSVEQSAHENAAL